MQQVYATCAPADIEVLPDGFVRYDQFCILYSQVWYPLYMLCQF